MEEIRFELLAEEQSNDLHRIYKYVVHFTDTNNQKRQHIWVYCTEQLEIEMNRSVDKYMAVEQMARVKLRKELTDNKKVELTQLVEVRLTSSDLNNLSLKRRQ